MRFRFFTAVAAHALVVSACSTATRGSASERCVPQSMDSSWTARGPVYRDCEVDHAARLRNQRVLPVGYTPTEACETAVLDYVVDEKGVPDLTTVKIVRGNSQTLARALIANLGALQYQPAMKNGAPVRQVVQLRYAATLTVRRARDFRPPPGPVYSCVP